MKSGFEIFPLRTDSFCDHFVNKASSELKPFRQRIEQQFAIENWSDVPSWVYHQNRRAKTNDTGLDTWRTATETRKGWYRYNRRTHSENVICGGIFSVWFWFRVQLNWFYPYSFPFKVTLTIKCKSLENESLYIDIAWWFSRYDACLGVP